MKKENILFGVLMAIGMSLIMAIAMLIIKVGFVSGFLIIILKEWLLGFAICLLPALFLPPLIEKLLKRFM